MSIAMMFIVGLCTFQVIITILFITYYRKWVTTMIGMVVSMCLGMAVGILFGTILGVVFHGDLFSSTIYAILIGLAVGFIAGIPVGLPAVIDGMVSGLMGGMMGAMLGDMVVMTNPDTMLKLLSFFVTMILILVLYTLEDSIRKTSHQAVFSFFNHPFVLILGITLLFIGLNHMGPVVE